MEMEKIIQICTGGRKRDVVLHYELRESLQGPSKQVRKHSARVWDRHHPCKDVVERRGKSLESCLLMSAASRKEVRHRKTPFRVS